MRLYLDHFGLREAPFGITPHPDFFFAGANRGPTLAALLHAITQDEGIVKVTGEVGSGKTMLCRMLLEKLPPTVETLYLANPSLSRQEILAAIADELGVPLAGQPAHAMGRALQAALIERYAAGKRVVVLIDEAHAMPAESLEEVRLLSNLETQSHKLLQIALFAQPELEQRLAAHDMRQLRERITEHFSLDPMTEKDVARYLEFRLRTAGYRGPNPFSRRAVGRIARHGAGLSRRINILADKSLLAAYAAGKHQVDAKEAQAAIRDARFLPLPAAGLALPALWGHRALAGLGLACGVMGAFAVGYFWPAATTASGAVGKVAPIASSAASESVSTLPSAMSFPSPNPQPNPQSNSPLHPHANLSLDTQLGTLTRRYLEDFNGWLLTAPPEHYFLQLLVADPVNGAEIENFLHRAEKTLDGQQLRVYRSNRSGKDRLGVIYGQYPSRQAAQAALQGLPATIRSTGPYPRQVVKLIAPKQNIFNNLN